MHNGKNNMKDSVSGAGKPIGKNQNNNDLNKSNESAPVCKICWGDDEDSC